MASFIICCTAGRKLDDVGSERDELSSLLAELRQRMVASTEQQQNEQNKFSDQLSQVKKRVSQLELEKAAITAELKSRSDRLAEVEAQFEEARHKVLHSPRFYMTRPTSAFMTLHEADTLLSKIDNSDC